MTSETHSICEVCVPAVDGKHGTVFIGGLADKAECCFCGYEHQSGLVATLDDKNGQQIRPWWCAGKLGIHRSNGKVIQHAR